MSLKEVFTCKGVCVCFFVPGGQDDPKSSGSLVNGEVKTRKCRTNPVLHDVKTCLSSLLHSLLITVFSYSFFFFLVCVAEESIRV